MLQYLQVDRVYLGSPNIVAVLDHEKKRTFVIRKEGLPDVGMTPFSFFSLIFFRFSNSTMYSLHK